MNLAQQQHRVIRPSTNLPNEIISHIIAIIPDLFIPWSYQSSIIGQHTTYASYLTMVFGLLQVSHLFRNIALHTPELWSRIYVDGRRSHLYPLELFIERSRLVPLHVVWDVTPKNLKKDKFGMFKPLFSHQDRWKELHVRDYRVFLECHKASDGYSEFPALETLSILATTLWATTINNINLLKFSPFANITATLITCRLGCARRIVFYDVIDFLANCKVLRHLYLNVECEEFSEASYRKINLPSLVSFELFILHSSLYQNEFLRLFHIPNLRNFSISVQIMDGIIPLDYLLDDLEVGDSVRSLTFDAQNWSGMIVHVAIPLRSIEQHFPNVSELTIKCHSNVTMTQFRACCMPALCTLTIFREWGDKGDDLEDLLVFLRNRETSNRISVECKPLKLRISKNERIESAESIKKAVSDGLLVLESDLAHVYPTLF